MLLTFLMKKQMQEKSFQPTIQSNIFLKHCLIFEVCSNKSDVFITERKKLMFTGRHLSTFKCLCIVYFCWENSIHVYNFKSRGFRFL